ncbi:G-protein coupled receptor dmsr-1-like [Saccostrea echinata]|uniref:G-protein coupled receptor dmsr-1-like n=1 Tax=Saccostrea echinata TaxID=191078 RepID=UPI002A7FDDA4|nr:G-protein coupled receptor dmsr-1-like [Saccostrea echinata]
MGLSLDEYSRWYGRWHGCLSLIVCCFGIPTNIINITVLTRKHMHTPINTILTWIAFFDIVTMVAYLPFVIHFYIEFPTNSLSPEKNSHGWMNFLLFYINLSTLTHTISIWLGVSLAIFRYVHIHSPETGSLTHMRRITHCRIAVSVVIFGSILLLIPNYMSSKLVPLERNGTILPKIKVLDDPRLGTPNVKVGVFISFILYSIIAKIIPCMLMMIFGALLLKTLDNHGRVNRKKLSKLGVVMNRPLNTSRTTVMLLIVMVLFLMTELPQGILLVLSLTIQDFFDTIYIPLGDTMDILALINNSINFVLYCSMSIEFRRTISKWIRHCLRASSLINENQNDFEVKNKNSAEAKKTKTSNSAGNTTTDEMQIGLPLTGCSESYSVAEINSPCCKSISDIQINGEILYSQISTEAESEKLIYEENNEISETIPLAQTATHSCSTAV